MEIPNLAGVATKNLVEQIGSGSFKASYINWSRTMQLLRENAPGWMVDYEPAADGSLLHRAPVGAYLMIRFRHIDGTVTPALPQAVMDHRNNAIPFEKITARDVTDTQRRGMCLACAMTFGLAHELWAKMPLESGYAKSESDSSPPSAATPKAKPKTVAKPVEHLKQEFHDKSEGELKFIQRCEELGITHSGTKDLLSRINGDYETGLANLNSKDDAWLRNWNKSHPDP